MTEIKVLYVKDKYSKISFSAEEFRELEAAAKKRGLYVEDYLEMIVEENRKLDEEIWGKIEKTKLDFLKQGDRLLKRFLKLEGKYGDRRWKEDEYTWCCRNTDKNSLLDKINRDLGIVHERVQVFSVPDMTRKEWDEPDKNQIAAGQRAVARVLGKTYKEIRAAVLRSYKRLEEDFVRFRREVLNARDEVFEEEILQV